MKAALIGNGFIGDTHRNAYRLLKEEGVDIELAAICDLRPEMLEKNSGERLYTNVEELLSLEKDIDYVDICLPTYLHAEYSIKCMKAGYNVLCEKPMALTYEECEEMLACSEETGKRLMIAQCCRFGTDLRIIKEFIEEGSFGRPVSAFFTATGGQPRWGYENWFADGKRSGGCMLDLQAHNLDLINWYFGVPQKTSTVAKQCTEDFTGYGSVSANMMYKDGLFVHSWCDWGIDTNQHNSRSIRINFEKGYLYNNRGAKHELVAVSYADKSVTDLSDRLSIPAPTYRAEIEYFAECLRTGAPFDICPPEESRYAVKVMRAQAKSADACGMPVDIEA